MFQELSTVASIHLGYPFRGKIIEKPDGYVRVVQMKQVDSLNGIRWNDLTFTDLPGRTPSRWLESGDVVFAARGITNYAVVADNPPEHTVLSPHFFQIRLHENSGMLPEFLAWQLNQTPAQKYFTKSAEGSAVIGVRKGLLENLEVICPPLAEQKKIMQAVRCWNEQQRVIQAMSDNHEKLMAAIANNVFNKTIG
jgi:hypothetical protein